MLNSENKILAGLSHLGIFFGFLGIIAVLVIYIIQREKSRFVAHHAKQALGYQLIIALFKQLVGLAGFSFIGFTSGFMRGMYLWQGLSIWGLFSLVILIYAVVASIKAFSGESFKYVLIGDFIDRI
ncbi:MAG: DUF4870 domain-containing protein [Bacillota bacterium]